MRDFQLWTGFQSGADIGAARAAKKCGVFVTGWMPRGYLTEDGPKPEYAIEYNALEHSSFQYPPRTEENIKNSTGIIVFGDPNSKGSSLVRRLNWRYRLPLLGVEVWGDTERAAKWLVSHNIKRLFVGGNRESKSPGIAQQVEDFMSDIFLRLKDLT